MSDENTTKKGGADAPVDRKILREVARAYWISNQKAAAGDADVDSEAQRKLWEAEKSAMTKTARKVIKRLERRGYVISAKPEA